MHNILYLRVLNTCNPENFSLVTLDELMNIMLEESVVHVGRYANRIRATIERLGLDVRADHVESWLVVRHGPEILDGKTDAFFNQAVRRAARNAAEYKCTDYIRHKLGL